MMPTDLAPGNCLHDDLPREPVEQSTEFIDGFADCKVAAQAKPLGKSLIGESADPYRRKV